MRSVGWVGWSSKTDTIRGTSGGSSTASHIKVYSSAGKAKAFSTGDTAREIFINEEPTDDQR